MILGLSSSLLLSSQGLNVFEKAVEKATKENKIIIIKATSKYCHYCKEMDKIVLTDNDIIKALDKDFVSVVVDLSKKNLPLGLKSTMTPTFFFLDSNKKLIKKVAGAWNKEDFLIILKEIKLLYIKEQKNQKDAK